MIDDEQEESVRVDAGLRERVDVHAEGVGRGISCSCVGRQREETYVKKNV